MSRQHDGDSKHSKTAARLVTAAMNQDFASEPIIGSEPLSRDISVVQSVICRHGLAIQSTIADMLSADDRYEVYRDHPMQISDTALELAQSRECRDALRWITLPWDGRSSRISSFDLLVVHLERHWVGAFDVKRGLGPTASAKRRTIEQNLIAARLTLPSFARSLGFHQVYLATSGVIDCYGAAGFDDEITVDRTDLDKLFDLPLSAAIDALTDALAEELQRALPDLFAKRESVGSPDAVIDLLKERNRRRRGPKTMGPIRKPRS